MEQQFPADKAGRENFIEKNKGFIYATACRICRRKLDWKNDDELSIALIAFDKACSSFEKFRGNFQSYAGVLIKNALIDFFRKARDIPCLTFDDDDDEKMDYIEYKSSMSEFEKLRENETREEEILLLSKELSEYNIDFDSLINSSPSHSDTRNELLNVAAECLKYESITAYMNKNKMLPIEKICKLTGKKRKYIEKWRRYIIVLMLVMSNSDYQYLKSYLNIYASQ